MADHLTAALVGLGWWGRQIADSLHTSDLIQLTRAVEPDLEAARSFCEAHGMTLTDDLGDALIDASVDAVIIATPHALHEQQVLAAAAAGKHAFCEKPLALTAAAARRMVETCRDHGVVLGVGHERRFEGALQRAATMATTGHLGTLLHVECNWSHNLFMGAATGGWRQDPSQAPAGTLTALGVHITDYFQSICGPVESVAASTASRSPHFPADDVITVQFRFHSGVTGVMSNLATTPFYQRIAIFGDEAWAEVREISNVDVPDPATLTWRGIDGEIHTSTFRHTDTVRANLEEWAAAVIGVGAYRFTEQQLVHNVEILEAIVRSAASGLPQKVG